MEMDCIRTQATISALHDSEQVTDESAEAARVHCDECEQCRAFESDLQVLQSLPLPMAPPELAGRVMVAVAALAAERAEEHKAVLADERSTETGEPEPSARFAWFTGRPRWGAYGALATAVAAVALVAVFISRAPAPQTGGIRETVTTATAPDLALSGQAPAQTAPAAPAPTPAPARAPDYLVYRSRVYVLGSLLADSTVATPSIGTVTTAFNGAGAPAQVSAYRSPLTDGSIVVRDPDGTRLYEPVVRKFMGVTYQLVAGNAVERFGVWPELPARFQAPALPDGSPTFVAAGGDALAVITYTARGVPQSQGFAIAPGTPGTDPAASNPNWTWWEPMQVP
jgi:negative regulator of sigma E activity